MKKSLSLKLIAAIAGAAVIAIALLIFFASSGNGSAQMEEVAPDVFQKNMLGGDYKNASYSVCESENAYHIFVSGNMYYVDKTDMRAVIACGKAECTHWGEDWDTCNSYLSDTPYYYSGKLYYCGFASKKGTSLYSLHSCDLDGTNRKFVQTLQTHHSGSVQESTIPVAIHNNIAMFQSTEGNFPTGANVYAGPLGTDAGDAVRLLSYETSDDTAAVLYDEVEIWDMWADGDYFYCVGLTASDSGTRKQVIYRYNPADGDFSQVWTVPDASEVGEWSETGVQVQGWYIDEGILWYYLDGNGVWTCDLDTGKNELVFSVKEDYAATASFDGQYIYINTGNADLSADLFGTTDLYAPFEERKIDVYDKTGGFIATISCADMYFEDTPERRSLGQSSGILGASDDYVFIACYSYGQDLNDIRVYALDKNSFDESNIQLLIEKSYTYDSETDTSTLIRTCNNMEPERLTRSR